MSDTWAIVIDRAAAETLAALRLSPQLAVGFADDVVWLKGSPPEAVLASALLRLPARERYDVLPDGRIIPHGKRVPIGRLPAVEWKSLAAACQVDFPAAALPGTTWDRLPLSIVRSQRVVTANAWCGSWAAFEAYALEASAVRLAKLVFAATHDQQVLVRGPVLPPLPGRTFVDDRGVLMPTGYAFELPIEAEIVRQILDLGERDVALFAPDGSWERIAGDVFVKATRSAVRMTRYALGMPEAADDHE